ncbi:MAG: MGMT family protein [Planctomycetia bacterium]|nr:MGMT family protein [Planctomycetia bacterium]
MPRQAKTPLSLVTVETALGCVAMLGSGNVLRQLTLGHATAEDAAAALDRVLVHDAEPEAWNPSLVDRLEAYALGDPVDFGDVRIDLDGMSDFRKSVLRACRRIPYGQTWTYGELAAKAGYPGSARAVGNCMARNRVPLVVPCHRVLAAGGRLGGFSAPGGAALKQKLLELESGMPVFC